MYILMIRKKTKTNTLNFLNLVLLNRFTTLPAYFPDSLIPVKLINNLSLANYYTILTQSNYETTRSN